MKRFELILGGTFVLARIFAVFEVLVYGLLTLLSALILYFTYFLLSFYLLNNKTWGDIFKKETYKNVGVFQSIVSILAGICLSSFVSGTLFVVMHWTNTFFAFYASIVFLVFISLTLLIGLKNEKYKTFSKQNLIRIGIVLFIGIISVFHAI